MDTLVTIKTAHIPSDLVVARSVLESEGIYCFVKDEIMSQLYPMFGGVGGAKLQVRGEDAEKAIAILIEGGFAKEEDYQ